MASIHTGLYPSQHGANLANRRLGPNSVMLAEVLKQHGYETAAVISHLFTSRRFGFARGPRPPTGTWATPRPRPSSPSPSS